MRNIRKHLTYLAFLIALSPQKVSASSWEVLSIFLESGPHTNSFNSYPHYHYPQFMNFLTNSQYSQIEGDWDIEVARRLISNFSEKIKPADLEILYNIAFKERENIVDCDLATYLSALILLDWKISGEKKNQPMPKKTLDLCDKILSDENVPQENKTMLTKILYLNQNVPFTSTALKKQIHLLVLNNGNIEFTVLFQLIAKNLIDLGEDSDIIQTILTVLVRNASNITDNDRINLTRLLLRKSDYVNHFLKNPDSRIAQKHRKVLSRFAYIYEKEGQIKHQTPRDYNEIREGKHLPDIDEKSGPNLEKVYQAWIDSSKTTLTRDNAYCVLYPPSTEPSALTQHGNFLEKFLSVKGRLSTTNLEWIDLWKLIEDETNPDYEGYNDIPGEWRRILWDSYYSLPKLKSGEYLPNLSRLDPEEHYKYPYQRRFDGWVSSIAKVTHENYSRIFTPTNQRPKALKSHGDFLINFLGNEVRFNETNLTYEDLERILTHSIYRKIPGNWQDIFLKHALPNIVFKNGEMIPQSFNRVIKYLENNQDLPEDMIKNLIHALDQDNLSIEDKLKILEVMRDHRSYLRHYDLLSQSEQSAYTKIALKIQSDLSGATTLSEKPLQTESKKKRNHKKKPTNTIIPVNLESQLITEESPESSSQKVKRLSSSKKKKAKLHEEILKDEREVLDKTTIETILPEVSSPPPQDQKSLKKEQRREKKELLKMGMEDPIAKRNAQRERAEEFFESKQYEDALAIAQGIIQMPNVQDDDYFRIIKIKGEIQSQKTGGGLRTPFSLGGLGVNNY